MDINAFTQKSQQAILQARTIAEQRQHAAVAPQHVLIALLGQSDTLFDPLLAKLGVNPADLAGSIQLALVTTVEGLIVAIPTTAFFVYFRNRVMTVSLEIGAVVEDMFERFRPAQ